VRPGKCTLISKDVAIATGTAKFYNDQKDFDPELIEGKLTFADRRGKLKLFH
jgi:hypothetical protein